MPDLFVRVPGIGFPRSSIMGLASNLSWQGSESIRLYADTITRTWHDTGDVAFNASPDHATVLSYTARLRLLGSSTIIDSEPLGKPTPDGNFVIVVALAGFLAYRPAGDYTISILVTDATGSTDSEVSNPFTLPLPWPTERVRVTDAVTAVRA